MSDALANLRAIFRDELDDQLAALEVQLERLASGEVADALPHIHRILHTLKGASRVVGYDTFASECHAHEEATLRTQDRAALLASLRAFAVRSAAWAASLHAPAPALSPTTPTPPRSVAPAPRSAETLRVRADRVAELVGQAEALVSLASAPPPEVQSLRGQLELVSQVLRRARAQVLQPELGSDLQRALFSVANLEERLAALERREQDTRQELAHAADQLFRRVRRLESERLAVLDPSLKRAAADAASLRGREVALEVQLGEIEADRSVCDALREPLTHLVRNAVDHGIEDPAERQQAGKRPQGRIVVRAIPLGREIRVEVRDDGRGVDVDAVKRRARELGLPIPEDDPVRLLFEPGFSTRRRADSLSGRGMGLDIVNRAVMRLQGHLETQTVPGLGTTIALQVPVDVRVVQGLVVLSGGQRFGLLLSSVERVTRTDPSELSVIGGHVFVRDGGGLMPVADLGAAEPPGASPLLLVWLLVGTVRVAVWVEQVLEVRELVLRPLSSRLAGCSLVAAAALLGDTAIPVLDPSALLAHASMRAASSLAGGGPSPPELLIVDDSATTRTLLRTVLESAGYNVTAVRDGVEALEALLSEPRYALVISDVDMPRMDGLQLLAQIRADARTTRLPVVLVTGRGSEQDKFRAGELGADAYIVKGSFDQDRLLATLESLLP
jgi:two-component system chemotaxis sensor kinase CheA